MPDALAVIPPLDPVTVNGKFPVAAEADAVNVSVDEPVPLMAAGEKLTVTPDGSPVTARFTALVNPLAEARVIFVVVFDPPTTVGAAGANEREKAGETVRFVEAVPAPEAVIVTPVEVVIDFAVTVNAAADAPAATDTVAGTVAAAVFELTSEMVMPAGAGLESVTVPDAVCPEATVDGVTETLCKFGKAGGFTVTPNDSVTPRYDAFNVSNVAAAAADGAKEKEADVEP